MKEKILNTIKDQQGQMLAEILVAVVLAGIIIGGIALSVGSSVSTGVQTKESSKAIYIIQRVFEEVKMLSESNWIAIYCPPSGSCPGSKGSSNRFYISNWTIQNGESSMIIEGVEYRYYFYIENVNRDSQQNIVTSGGTEDPSTQKITVTVSWGNASFSISQYIMRTTSASFVDRAWSVNLVDDSNTFTNAYGYYATSSGTLVIQTGTLTLNPTNNSGSLTSVVFDTGRTNGAAFNGIKWKGSLPTSARVRFQFASSNSPSGPWNFIGPDGTTATYYEASGSNQIMPISLQYHNNHRYFRYKIYLDPKSDNSEAPIVYSVVVNYSP